jgi:hypothetical protein
MSQSSLSRRQIADLYFIEHRAKLLDLASFLDRADKAAPDSGSAKDVRLTAMERAIALLLDGKPDRARRVLESLSDPTTAPIAKAGTKGSLGAWPGAPDSEGRK